MEDKIISIIKKENGKLTFKNLMHKVNISRDELGDLLLKLKLDGKILQKGNKYSLFPDDLCIGSITISSTGRKYIFYNDDKINAGNKIFTELMNQDNPIRKNFTDKTISRGSFNGLANEKTIGWHPDYLDLI